MLVVAQEDGIDGADLVSAKCRISGFFERHIRQCVLAWAVEGGVGQKAEAVQFNKRRRAPNQGNRGCGHVLSFASRAIAQKETPPE